MPTEIADVVARAFEIEVAVRAAAPLRSTSESAPMNAAVEWPTVELSVTPVPEPKRPMLVTVVVTFELFVELAVPVRDVPLRWVSGPTYTRVAPLTVPVEFMIATLAMRLKPAPVVNPFAVLFDVAVSVTGPTKLTLTSEAVGDAPAGLPRYASTKLDTEALVFRSLNATSVTEMPRAVASATAIAFASIATEAPCTSAPSPA